MALGATVFEPVNWGNLRWILDSNRSLFALDQPLAQKALDKEKNTTDPSRLTAENSLMDELYSKLGLVSVKVAPALKGPRPKDAALDLSATGFWDCDWKGADLSGADLTGMALFRADLEGANLSGITRFQGANFDGTPWWNAAVISPTLFGYLLENYPHNAQVHYGPSLQPISQATYEAALKTLKKASSIP